jgi:hypothetical protein
MKTSILCIAVLALAGSALRAADGKPDVVPASVMSAREGFTRSGTSVLMTRAGVTQKVERDVTLENGMRVSVDGSVVLPGGEKTSLKNNQLLTLGGTFEDVALTPQGTALGATGASPINKPGADVGISSHDGISLSGNEALVTRNGISQRLANDLKLGNGATVQRDGTVLYSDGSRITLKAGQILTFDGVLRDMPPRSPAGR